MKVKRIPVLSNQDEIYRTLGKAIAEGRARNNLSQRELAHIVGLSRSSVNSVERGQQHLLVGDALLIAQVLGIRLDGLRFPGLKAVKVWARMRLNDFYKVLTEESSAQENHPQG